MNFKNLTLIGCALLVASGCSQSRKQYDEGFVGGHRTMDQFKGPVPGSAEDFAASVTDRISFLTNASAVSEEMKVILDKQVEWMATYPSVDLLIEGHCDVRGTREYNLALGERRADAVRKYLVSKGVEAKRLHVVSYGKERPQVEGDCSDAHAKNRVAISVIQ